MDHLQHMTSLGWGKTGAVRAGKPPLPSWTHEGGGDVSPRSAVYTLVDRQLGGYVYDGGKQAKYFGTLPATTSQ